MNAALNPDKPILLVALGGNALIRKGQEGTIEQQFRNLRLPVRQIARLSRDWRVIITHGNGPQVGNLLLQQECCNATPKMPLEILVAQTEGQIGYMIESTLDEELMGLGVDFRPLVSLITYVVVDKDDPALTNPTKPIGPSYSETEANALPYPVRKTAKGWRRVVGSPEPVGIIEHREIQQLIDMDFIVVCCGGGGIPVVRKDRGFHGVDAVIDKDLASSLLAGMVNADLFMMATDVQGAMLNFGTPEQEMIQTMTVSEAEKYEKQGHFPPGSMLPKVEAGKRFVRKTGNKAVLCSINDIEKAVSGSSGTAIISDIQR